MDLLVADRQVRIASKLRLNPNSLTPLPKILRSQHRATPKASTSNRKQEIVKLPRHLIEYLFCTGCLTLDKLIIIVGVDKFCFILLAGFFAGILPVGHGVPGDYYVGAVTLDGFFFQGWRILGHDNISSKPQLFSHIRKRHRMVPRRVRAHTLDSGFKC